MLSGVTTLEFCKKNLEPIKIMGFKTIEIINYVPLYVKNCTCFYTYVLVM